MTQTEIDRLTSDLAAAQAEVARLRRVLDDIEQVGNNPADLASDLHPANNPGKSREDCLWMLVQRLASMAFDATKHPATKEAGVIE